MTKRQEDPPMTKGDKIKVFLFWYCVLGVLYWFLSGGTAREDDGLGYRIAMTLLCPPAMMAFWAYQDQKCNESRRDLDLAIRRSNLKRHLREQEIAEREARLDVWRDAR